MDYRALSTLYYTKYYAADKASTLSSCPHAPIMLPLCPHYTKDYIETGLPPLIYPLLYQGTTNASTLSSCPHNSHYPPITPNLSAALYHQYRPRTTGIYYHVFLTLFLWESVGGHVPHTPIYYSIYIYIWWTYILYGYYV